MADSSETVDGRSESSNLPPPSQPAADSANPATAYNETERLCQIGCSRVLAKHFESVVADIPNIDQRLHKVSDVPELRRRLQDALRLAPNPAKLVYECCKHIEDGQAYLLFLETFLMICDGEVGVELSVSSKAHDSAWRWRNMYRARGGYEEDHRIQARGFLLFLACFGIPDGFPNDYVMNLIILSFPNEISETLRKSQVLVPIIPDMIEKMLQYKLYGEAIDVAFTFGIEDKFPYKPIIASLKGDYQKMTRELSSYSVKEMEKASLNLLSKFMTITDALGDRRLIIIDKYYKPMCGLIQVIRTRLEEAKLRSKSNDDSVDYGKRYEMEMEMEMELEHPSLARRVSSFRVRTERPRKECIICYLI